MDWIIKLSLASILCLVLHYAITTVVCWFRLRKFPGPLLASISYIPMLKRSRSGRAYAEYYDMSGQYGSIVRIGPNDLLTSDAELIRRMSAARSTYSRSTWYRAMRLDPYHDTMGSVRDTDVHDALKAKTASGYAGKENPKLAFGIDSQVAALVDLLRKKYTSNADVLRPVDFGKVAQYFTLDSLTSVAFGEPFGFLTKDGDVHEYIKTTEDLVNLIPTFAEIPWLQRIFLSNWMLRLIGPKETDSKGVGKLMGQVQIQYLQNF